MRWFKRRKASGNELAETPSSRSEALTYYPVKSSAVLEVKLDTGEIVLTYPLTLRPWLLNLARRMGLRSSGGLTRKLQLDAMGSHAWSLLDGQRTVQDLVNYLGRHYNLNRKEAEVAMTRYLRELGRRGLIGFRPPQLDDSEKST